MDIMQPSPATSTVDSLRDVQASTATSTDDSSWRDWLGHPDILNAMWPQLFASKLPSSSWLALLGTCSFTRDATLCDAPQAKLTMPITPSAWPDTPTPAPLLLLRRTGRTKPTTLAVVNKHAGKGCLNSSSLPPLVTTIQAQSVLGHPALQGSTHSLQPPSTAITRLQLCGIRLDLPLLQAMQGLPSLTHLDLHDIDVPSTAGTAYVFDAACFPRNLHTLTIQPNNLQPKKLDAYVSLLSEFLSLDTITDLALMSNASSSAPPRSHPRHQCLLDNILVAMISLGITARALRKLSAPCVLLDDTLASALRLAAPLLDDLEVHSTHMWSLDADQDLLAVTWRTLHVADLCLDGCRGLPLGGIAGDLEIHVKRALCVMDRQFVEEGVTHLTSPATRGVRLVGSGSSGGAFTWNKHDDDVINAEGFRLQDVLSVLQLSNNPVTRLELLNLKKLDPQDLATALAPLPALTRLKIEVVQWEESSHLDKLLTLLPLNVQRVCLEGGWSAEGLYKFRVADYRAQALRVFQGMLTNASKVPERQARPLRVCVLARPLATTSTLPGWPTRVHTYDEGSLGPAGGLWCLVEESRKHGKKGVALLEEWD